MPETADKNQAFLTHLKSAIDVGGSELIEINVTEVNLTESLLTPGLQTNVVVQSRRSETPGYVLKNLDNFYAKGLILSLERPIIKAYSKSVESKLDVSQLVYRLSKRKRIRSEEHTSELQSRFGISYAVFCLKKKTRIYRHTSIHRHICAKSY